MYSTCLFCNSALGANEVIENFPVGRRLAFDAAKGRLWVVCRRCERWNLTPLEERWEAIEEAERLFVETRLRVSTDNIGLARLREGLELVRIGPAQRPEMAAWRYGDQFGRRRRRAIAWSVAGTAAVGLVIAAPATGIVAGSGWLTWQLASNAYGLYQSRRIRARIRVPEVEKPIPMRKKELDFAAIIRVEDDWGLRLRISEERVRPSAARERVHVIAGPHAMGAVAQLLPAINASGGKSDQVQSAVRLVTEAGEPAHLFRRYAQADEREIKRDPRSRMIMHLPKEVRLALEMASHEEQERRALEGELALLEAAWRDAEEVATIADDLLHPEAGQRLDQLKRED